AGKSTLFNLLLGRERTLTGATPGLTRDPVVECTTLAGYPYELVDTAGEGVSTSAVDCEAIAIGRAQRRSGLILLVIDATEGPSHLDRALAASAALVIATKVDLPVVAWPADLPRHLQVSAATWDAATLRVEIGTLLRRHRQLPMAGRVGGAAALTPTQVAQLRHHTAAIEGA
ncbi:MAG: GTPase, partial [Planctomycetota bacterium]